MSLVCTFHHSCRISPTTCINGFLLFHGNSIDTVAISMQSDWELHWGITAVGLFGASRRSLISFICPIVPKAFNRTLQFSCSWTQRDRVNTQFLCSLNRGIEPARDSPLLRMALLSVWSLLNKTFILHDYFRSQNLNFLFLTETCIKDGDLSPFTELVPLNCTFFSTSRLSGRGGGLAAVF